MTIFANTPEPPYWAVVFTSLRRPGDDKDDDPGYDSTASDMLLLAAKQPGYLGVESARGEDGLGITVSYWRDRESIAAWKAQADHLAVQEKGRQEWYGAYRVRIAKVERETAWKK